MLMDGAHTEVNWRSCRLPGASEAFFTKVRKCCAWECCAALLCCDGQWPDWFCSEDGQWTWWQPDLTAVEELRHSLPLDDQGMKRLLIRLHRERAFERAKGFRLLGRTICRGAVRCALGVSEQSHGGSAEALHGNRK